MWFGTWNFRVRIPGSSALGSFLAGCGHTVIGQVRGALNPIGLPNSGLSPAEDDTAHALCSKESN